MKSTISTISMGIVTAIVAFGGCAFGQSFDCTAAHSKMEKIICSDESLSKADELLSVAFKRAKTVSPDKSIILKWQRSWLKSYAVSDCDDASCLLSEYLKRIGLLNDVVSVTDDAGAWSGNYDRYTQGREDPDSASLMLVGLSGGRVYLEGTSIWQGPNAKNGQVNVGEIEGVGSIAEERLRFDSDGCSAEVLLVESGIVVENESGCGGMNVTFDGTYRK